MDLLQGWEDELVVIQRKDDFHQRVMAATFPHDPTLASARALLGIEEAKESVDERGVFFPKTEEEFREMMQILDQEDQPKGPR